MSAESAPGERPPVPGAQSVGQPIRECIYETDHLAYSHQSTLLGQAALGLLRRLVAATRGVIPGRSCSEQR